MGGPPCCRTSRASLSRWLFRSLYQSTSPAAVACITNSAGEQCRGAAHVIEVEVGADEPFQGRVAVGNLTQTPDQGVELPAGVDATVDQGQAVASLHHVTVHRLRAHRRK